MRSARLRASSRGHLPALIAGAATLAAAILFTGTSSTAPARGPAAAPERIDRSPSVVERLPARKLAGQRVIYSYRGLKPPGRLLRKIRRGEAAGVIFFGANIRSKAQIHRVTRHLQRARRDARPRALRRLPLLLMTDQEGGVVRRLHGAPRRSQLEIARADRSGRLAKRAGRGAGRNLAGVGMNVNLAPVLGVLRPPADGSFLGQFGRTYGPNPRKVRRLAAKFIEAQQGQGVAATSKHFPGLGAADKEQNTDEVPVTLDLSRRTLRTVDELPYPRAIAAGTRLVMISNARYPALDRDRPATLSRPIIEGELRGRLGFRGVTITDALGAGALRDFGGTASRSRLSAAAGADLLLYAAQDVSEGIAGHHALTQALRKNRLDRSRFERSAARVLKLRRELRGSDPLP
ncbi:MAG: beta-N-acetylhexosaminidase [Solirubrobacterales bacterium]|nr:beta-N-acetylhexosaminidase [Solirubrobacterales bacterium]